MEEKENKRISIIVDDENSGQDSSSTESKPKIDKLKKPLIFGLMGIVFIACLYLIFKPKDSGNEGLDIGLKKVVPEATDKGLQEDKQKAYEKEMIEEQEAAKRTSLQSLADYWNNGSDSTKKVEIPVSHTISSGGYNHSGYQNSSLNSYKNAQSILTSFYQDDDREKQELRRKIGQLENKLSEKDIPTGPTMKDQLTLMEKSYEMASKYLPAGVKQSPVSVGIGLKDSMPILSNPNKKVESLKGVRKSVVSTLYRVPDDSLFLAGLQPDRYRTFFTVGSKHRDDFSGNSIRAMIMETKTIIGDGTVKLRLQEDVTITDNRIYKGTEIEASAKFQGNRLMLLVSSVAVNGNVIPIEMVGYDPNGQIGLSVPRSDEINAAGEIAANMSQTSGMNISMSRSAGQQLTGDLSRGLIQGVSGYFSKKLRATKITLKAGHQVLLVTKK